MRGMGSTGGCRCMPQLGAVIVFLPFTVYAYDVGEILYIVVAAPVVLFILLVTAVVFAIRRRSRLSLSVLSMLVVYCAVTAGLFIKSYDLRTVERWFLYSGKYKADVLAQPSSGDGELKHIEWDGWGFGGDDTEVYLVFDPGDTLSVAALRHSSGKFSGTLCGVSRVRRLERQWYSVEFYTDTAWGQCN